MANRRMRPWELIYEGFDPDQQSLREALCALGNGWIVTRGAFEEAHAGDVHYPGTYLAGGYNRLQSEISGRVIENEDLVNWPNWLPLTFRAGEGDWFSPDSVDLQELEVCLDVRRGLLERRLRFLDREGRAFSLRSRRLVHMALPHLAAIEWELTSHDWSGPMEIRSALDGTVRNENVARYKDLENRHLDVLDMGTQGQDAIFLTVQSNQSLIRMTQAARTQVFQEDRSVVSARRETDQEEGWIAQRLLVNCTKGKPLRIEKVVAIHTSRDPAISESSLAARKEVGRAGSFAQLVRSHECRWCHLWTVSDTELHGGDVETQLILRLHIFHLLQTASPNTIDRDAGIPARGWHGEAYRGHVFWDELFVFPFLNLRIPELARSLLLYRYRRLPEARYAASAAGFSGAMFPWQSGSDGREETQVLHLNPRSGRWVPDNTHLQRHVNAAIAYNVWEYQQATDDIRFFSQYGAEILLEIARFWASIVTYSPERGRYEIRGVVGPDEFHTKDPETEEPGLNNNAYTNVMASWVLWRAGQAFRRLDRERCQELKEKLGIDDEDLARWAEISRKLFVPFHGDGIISQFEGYEQLEEFDWEGYKQKYGDIHRLDRILEAEGDDVNRYKASKQPDVLMLLYLFSAEGLSYLFKRLGYEFDPEWIPRNIEYYTRRSSHGSTLSNVVESWVMARAQREEGWQLFQRALRADIEDIQGGTTPEGIHLGAIAGTVDLIQRGHTGLVMRDDVLWFDPVLPKQLADLSLRLHFRGNWLSVHCSDAGLTVSCDRCLSPPVKIGFRGSVQELAPGQKAEFKSD